MDSKKERKGTMGRLVDCIKDYYGPVPVLSGIIAAGAAGTAAFALSAIYNSSQSVTTLLANRNVDVVSILYNIPDTILKIYKESSTFSSYWSAPGFAIGQFAGYKLKKTVRSWFKKK
jgi:hypothetical protein